MKLKRVLAILLALCMILPLAACTGDGDATTTTTAGDTVTTTVNQSVEGDDPVEDVTTTVATDDEGNEITTTTTVETDDEGNEITTTTVTNDKGEPVATTTKQGDKVTTTKQGDKVTTTRSKVSKTLNTKTSKGEGDTATLVDITIKEGTKKLTDGLDFGGKTFTFAQNGTPNPNSDYGKNIAAFGKKYNCKVDVSGYPYSEYTVGITSAMAGGKSYDIVFMVNAWYPEQILANTMTELDDVITTADLWNEKSATEGGLSYSLSNAMSLNGHIYVLSGAYMASPGMIFYNKKMFADAGYDGKNDPLALYNAGKWSWDKYYEILTDIQDREKGLYGMNSISPYYFRMILPSFGTDIAKRTSTTIVQNLNDPQLYKALETLQKFNYGEHSVCDPKNQYEDGHDQFLNGTTASLMSYSGQIRMLYDRMEEKTFSAFGTKAQQMGNIGMVPLPVANSKGIHAIWDWMGYGAGNGTTEDGKKAAAAWAMYESIVNHKNVYDERMPESYKKVAKAVVDTDKLAAPMWGFESSAGSLGGMQGSIARKIANEGQSIAVVLKGHEKLVETIINAALKR